MNILRSYLNCCTIVNWKIRKRTNTLKGSQKMGGGRIFLKPSSHLSLMKTCRMSLISARSISLDSTFNRVNELKTISRRCPYYHSSWDLPHTPLRLGFREASSLFFVTLLYIFFFLNACPVFLSYYLDKYVKFRDKCCQCSGPRAAFGSSVRIRIRTKMSRTRNTDCSK